MKRYQRSREGRYAGHAPVEGRGVIKCAECGKPTRDHSLLGPCPDLVKIIGTSRMTVPSPRMARLEKERAEE